MIKNTEISKKDISIELARIIACFFVICIHIDFGFVGNGAVSKSAVLLACFRADAVAIFWLIAGIHFFKERPYKEVLKNLLFRIVIPTLIIMGITFYFSEWILGNCSFLESIAHSGQEYAAFFRAMFLDWNIPVPHAGQLWYIFVYALLCVIQPVGVAIVKHLNTKRRQIIFCVVSLAFLILNDFSLNAFGSFSHHTFGGAIPGLIIMIWGKLLYDHREEIQKRINTALLFAAFIGLNLLRCFIESYLYQTHDASRYILYWFTSFGLCCASAVYFICLKICNRMKKDGLWAKIIIGVGGGTFTIYLTHMLVKDFLFQHGLSGSVMSRTSVLPHTLISHGLYYLICGGIIFVICLLISIGISALKGVFRRMSRSENN